MRSLAVIVAYLCLLPAQSWGSCQAETQLTRPLSERQLALKSTFEDILSGFHQMGLTHLTEAYDQQLVRVEFRPQALSSGPSAVSWRSTLFAGKRILVIRRLNWESEAAHQGAIWAVAAALYRLELDKRLWSARAMFPSHPAAVQTYNLPAAWRDARLADVNELQDEMYRLIERLDQLDPEAILPAHDPGRYWWLGRQMFPNVEDLQMRQASSQAAVASSNGNRYARTTIAGYYFDWVRRLALIGLLTQGAVLSLPYVSEVPGLVESTLGVNTHVEPATVGPDRSLLERKQFLERTIRQEESKVLDPDNHKIERLKAEYRDLLDQNPWLVQPTAPAPK